MNLKDDMLRNNFIWNLHIKDELIPEYDSTGLGRESSLTRDNFLEQKTLTPKPFLDPLISTLPLAACPAEVGA